MKTPNSKLLSLALALTTLGAVIQQSEAASFVYTGSIHYGGGGDTATLLPNGKVLIAGGWGAAANRAELYNPATGTWTVTGSMHAARAGATATLLPNGKVLVAGGGESGGSFESSTTCELYDPATGTWALTGSMSHARVLYDRATLLPNGKVLVADGGSSELYDPASGTWTDTGSASISPRTATLLPNGKVLSVGWDPAAELYDPATGMWTATGAPTGVYSGGYFRPYYTATLLLNGKVLAAGGNRIFAAELYDPDSGTWSATGSLTWDRDYCTATLLRNGQVLVAGGYQQETDTPMTTAELYDPTTGTWTLIPMNRALFGQRATLLPNGKVLVAGGSGGTSAELFEPDSDGALSSLTILHQADQVLSFSWTGLGTLEQSDSLIAPNWQPAPIQDDPDTVSTADAMKFYRVKAD